MHAPFPDNLELLTKFISSERKEDFEMLATKNTYIQSAYKTLQVIRQDDQKRMEYEARQKALRDYNQGMLEAEERGREEGIKEGEQRGREEGIKALILDNLEEQVTQERILRKLQKRFSLSEKEAKQYYEQCSKLE